MRKIVVIMFVVICLVSNVAGAEEKMPYQAKAELFLTFLFEGQVDKAYNVLFKGSPLEQNAQQVAYIKTQTSGVLSISGKLLEFEFIKQENYGNSIVRLVYVIKAEQIPITFELYFYKPKTEWILINITFDTQFGLLADK